MKIKKSAMIVTAITILIAFFSYFYLDFITLTKWSINIFDTITDTGSILNYYSYSANTSSEIYHIYVGSDPFIYLPWAIWNVPIWLIQTFFDIRIVSQISLLLYSKLFLVLVSGGILWISNKLLVHLNIEKEERKQIAFLSISSLFLITSILYVGQNDVIAIFPFLYGLYAFIKGKKLPFFMAAFISILFKPFFIFSYIAIICYQEKKLTSIVLAGLFSLCPLFLGKLLLGNIPLYQESLNHGPSSEIMDLLFSTTLPLTPNGISVFIVMIFTVCIMAYFSTVKETPKEQAYDLIYYGCAPIFILLLTTTQEFYRGVYLVPLWYLLIGLNGQYKRINLLLEMVVILTISYEAMATNLLYYNAKYVGLSSITKELPSFYYLQLPFNEVIASSILFIAIVLILIINHPKFRLKNPTLCLEPEGWIMIIRSILYSLPVISGVLIYIFYR